VVDDFTRECLAIEVDTSLSGQRVARVLDQISQGRGLTPSTDSDSLSNHHEPIMAGRR
jgi:transposase InsO family protein